MNANKLAITADSNQFISSCVSRKVCSESLDETYGRIKINARDNKPQTR